MVLSKRNELGILSNFANTPFEYRGKRYRTVEGLWQSMLYPENIEDPRFDSAEWPHKREELEQVLGFPAKKVKEVLLATGDLVLLPDHLTTPEDPPAWRYYQIWMEIRESLN